MKANELTNELVEVFRAEGVVRIPKVISESEAKRFRQAAMRVLHQMQAENPHNYSGRAFHQKVNIWCQNEIMRELTFHPNLAAVATRLAGTKLRIWHDHILAKMPELSIPTAFHQDLVKNGLMIEKAWRCQLGLLCRTLPLKWVACLFYLVPIS